MFCLFSGNIHLLRLRKMGSTKKGRFYFWIQVLRRQGPELICNNNNNKIRDCVRVNACSSTQYTQSSFIFFVRRRAQPDPRRGLHPPNPITPQPTPVLQPTNNYYYCYGCNLCCIHIHEHMWMREKIQFKMATILRSDTFFKYNFFFSY